MRPLETRTAIQYQIESVVTNNTGYYDTIYQDHLKQPNASLVNEDHTDVQFSLLHRSLQSAKFQGFQDLTFELSTYCGSVLNLRERLATTVGCPIFLRNSKEVWEAVRLIETAKESKTGLLDYQLLNKLHEYRQNSDNFKPLQRKELSADDLRVLQATETLGKSIQISQTVGLPEKDWILLKYLEVIEPEVNYCGAF